jgi:NADH-quinone oxidoreductase subunit L
MFHVVTHAFFKALLFLGAGSVIHAMGGEQDIRRMGGLSKKIKITFLTFLIASLAISGIPPFAGFFSKDEILGHAFAYSPAVWLILSASSMLTAFYMFRLVYLVFFTGFRGSEEQEHHVHESPAVMTFPLIILCALSIVGGFMGLPEILGSKHMFSEYLGSVFIKSKVFIVHEGGESPGLEWTLILVAVLAAIASILYARYRYVSRKELPVADVELAGATKVLSNKFYVDELYEKIIVRPVMVLSDIFLVLVDKLIFDLSVNAVAWIASATGKTLRLVQTGNTGVYIFMMVLGIIALMVVQLFINLPPIAF